MAWFGSPGRADSCPMRPRWLARPPCHPAMPDTKARSASASLAMEPLSHGQEPPRGGAQQPIVVAAGQNLCVRRQFG